MKIDRTDSRSANERRASRRGMQMRMDADWSDAVKHRGMQMSVLAVAGNDAKGPGRSPQGRRRTKIANTR